MLKLFVDIKRGYQSTRVGMLLTTLSLLIFNYPIYAGSYSITRSQIGGVSSSNLSSGNFTLQRAFAQPVIVGVKNQSGYYLISGYLYIATDNPRIIAVSPAPDSYALSVSTFIKVYFENDIDAGSLSASDVVRVYEKKDNLAASLNRPASVKLSYSPSEKSLDIRPESGAFKNNYIYLVEISSSIKEPEEGLSLEDKVVWRFSTIASRYITNVFEYDFNPLLKVEVPPEVISADEYFILVSTNPTVSPVKVLPDAIVEANAKAIRQEDTRRIEEYYEIAPLDRNMEKINNLDGAVNVSMPFQAAKKYRAAIMNYPNLSFKRKYNLYYLNEEKKLWVKVPTVSVDLNDGVIKGALPYLGTFSVIADPDYDLTTAYAFPVPFSPNENPNHKNIIFADLATRCTIKIFTITGELVNELEYDANSAPVPYYEWDVKNKDGAPVASGVYFYLIESPKDKKLGKLMIIR